MFINILTLTIYVCYHKNIGKRIRKTFLLRKVDRLPQNKIILEVIAMTKEYLLSLGMQENEISHWQSDLYLKVNDISKKIVNGYEFKNQVTTFIDNIDEELWYEIPFSNSDYWNEKIKNK